MGRRSPVQPVRMNGVVHVIQGVMPPGFSFPYEQIDAWLPLGSIPAPPRAAHDLAAVARLKAGVTLEQARAEMAGLGKQLEQAYPDANRNWNTRVEPLMSVVVGDVGRRLWILFGAVTVVLLIACANVASLLLARASTRQREMTVRAALGASRGRIIRQLLSESLLLSFTGAALALVLATVGVNVFVALAGNAIPRASEIRIDLSVFGFAMVLAVVTGVVFGLAPAWTSSEGSLRESMQSGGRTTGERGRMRQGLIVAEVALTLLLLTAAGLLLRSFHRLQDVNQGFNTEHILSVDLTLPGVKYNTSALQARFFESLIENLRTLPGVEDVGITSRLPLAQKRGLMLAYAVDGQPRPADSPPNVMDALTASPGYFRVMGIHVLGGRLFSEEDDATSSRVVIVDEELAARHWPNADPIGRRLRLENVGLSDPYLTVVGVVPRVKLGSLSDRGGLPQAYLPAKQIPVINTSIVLKTRVTPTTLAGAIRERVRGLDSAQPIHNIRTIQAVRDQSLAPARLNVSLLSVFACVALTVSVSGLYGLLAYTVARRQREIGVRTALGARPIDVLRQILREGLQLTAAGIVLGTLASMWFMRSLSTLLFDTTPYDPATFAAVAILILVVALAACWIPARSAAAIDPIRALRDQ